MNGYKVLTLLAQDFLLLVLWEDVKRLLKNNFPLFRRNSKENLERKWEVIS